MKRDQEHLYFSELNHRQFHSFDFFSFLAYFPVVVIPGGASGLVFSEAAITPNYLAIRNIYGKYYLNGNWQMMSEGVYEISGTKFVYERNYREPERLTAEGPTTQDIVLEVSIITHYFIKDCSCVVYIGQWKQTHLTLKTHVW